MKKSRRIVFGIIGVFILVQLIPLDRSNPPITDDIDAPPEVKSILRESCYDCHSHETNWPWYSYVAPVSFLVVHDVHEARDHLNFSDWSNSRHKDEIVEEIEEGEMPLPVYLLLHRSAKVTESELDVLRAYFRTAETAPGRGDERGDHRHHEH